jgi:hypothetical protein
MNVEIGAEAEQFPEKEYISGIAVAVYMRLRATTACLFTLTGDRGLSQERLQQKSRGLFSYIPFIGESKDERSLLLYIYIVILQNYLFTMYVQCSTLGRSDLDLFN